MATSESKEGSGVRTSAFQTLSRVKHDGKDHPRGATIRLTPKQADHLLKTGAVRPAD